GIDHLALDHVLHVNHRRRPVDDDGFFQRADLQLDVYVCGELRGQLDVLAFDGRKAGQREGDAVSARSQIENLVLTLGVGRGRSGTLDERRTGGLDRDAGQDRTADILHHTGDAGCLRE